MRAVVIALGCLILSLTGCATPYQASSSPNGFGYSDTRLSQNAFLVSFQGNAATPRETVDTYLLYRCAELTEQEGFDYFILAEGHSEDVHQSFTAPGSFSSTTTFSTMYHAGQYTPMGARTTGTYPPPQTYHFSMPRATALIKTYHGGPPEHEPRAFKASGVLQYLGPKVRPTKEPAE